MKNLHFSQFGLLKALAVLLIILTAANGVLKACTVPVFRYALERWSADAYQVEILHRGDLSVEEKTAAQMLEAYTRDSEKPINFTVSYVNAANEPNGPEQTQLNVYYPFDRSKDVVIWRAPVTKEAVGILVDSPVRKEISSRLLAGDSAVWILLESGDKQKDEAVSKLLAEQLEIQQKNVRLPEAALSSESEDDIEVVFSMVRLSRDDRTEQFLVSSLLEIESDLRDFNEPMVWPVFGRGRALLPFVGKGITKENIAYGCQFLCGPCACTIKFDSPGFDLLIGADWQTVSQMYAEQEYTQELTGVFLEPETKEANKTEIKEAEQIETAVEDIEQQTGPIRTAVYVILGIVLIVMGASLMVIKRRKNK